MSIVSIVLAFAALAPAAGHVQSVTWEQIWDQPEAAIIYADRASITGPAELRSIRTRTVYREPLPEGNITERIRVEEFDCLQPRTRLRQVTILRNNGSPPQTQDWLPGESTWASVGPESLGATKREIACAGARPGPNPVA